jgi:hypothetical protein
LLSLKSCAKTKPEGRSKKSFPVLASSDRQKRQRH